MALDGAAAAWLGGSSGGALFLAGDRVNSPGLLAVVSAVAVTVALLTYRAFAAMRRPVYPLPTFDLQPIEAQEPDLAPEELLLTAAMAFPREELLLTRDMAVLTSELLLTRGQMLNPPLAEEPDLLLLDDVLARLQPDSRVVQLFDPEKLPTAGELQSRIERHISNATRVAPVEGRPDASQALYDALADLRRSLA